MKKYRLKSLPEKVVELPSEVAQVTSDYFYLLTGLDKEKAQPFFTRTNPESAIFNLKQLDPENRLHNAYRLIGQTLSGQDLVYLNIAHMRMRWDQIHDKTQFENSIISKLEYDVSISQINDVIPFIIHKIMVKYPYVFDSHYHRVFSKIFPLN